MITICKLFGCAGPGINQDDLRFARTLAYTSGLGGQHGSGVVQGRALKSSLEYILEKSRNEISYFLWYHQNHEGGNERLFNSVMDNFLIGHVRYATVGGISDQNSHPFDIDQIIGVHNGTLTDEKYQHLEKTDSEMMFEDVNTRGLIPVLQELDKDSAYAIVLLSKRTNEISFTRNDKRSLWYAVNTKRNVFYWSTERVMLMFAAVREGIDISTPMPFTPGLVYTFSPLDVQTDRTPNWRIRNVHPVDVDDPGITPIGDNILRLPAPSTNRKIDKEIEKRQKKASKLHQDCTYCDKVMDLYDQYKGVELEDGTYSCAECAEITTQITNHASKRGLLN